MAYYWVVANKNFKFAGGVRHIIKSGADVEKTKRDYYEKYDKLSGDEFILFKTLREAQNYANRLLEES